MWKRPGCQSASERLTGSESADAGFRFELRSNGEGGDRACPLCSLTSSEYQMILKLILSRTQSQTPSVAERRSAARFHFILTRISNSVLRERCVQDSKETLGLKKASARSPPADVEISLTVGHGAQHCLPSPSAVLQAYSSLTLRINEPWTQGKDTRHSSLQGKERHFMKEDRLKLVSRKGWEVGGQILVFKS